MIGFQSTAMFATRRRVVSTVERATFVCFSIGPHRFAAPVELIDRVLRPSARGNPVLFDGRALRTADLASAIGVASDGERAPSTRVLVCHVNDEWWALPVDAVHEVLAVDVTDILPLPTDHPDAHRTSVMAAFTREGALVLVLDLLGLLS